MTSSLPEIKIISFGKLTEPWSSLCAKYIKQSSKLSHQVLKEPPGDPLTTSKKAHEAILKFQSNDTFLIVCDQRGQLLSSSGLAETLSGVGSNFKQIIITIGPSYGFSQDTLNLANIVWSLTDLTLTHDFARTMVHEQVYRAQAILTNHPYHH